MYDFWQRPEDFWAAAFETLTLLELPYLSFSIRSDLPIRRHERRIFEGIVQHLRSDPRASRFVFTTPEDALRRLGLAAPRA